MLHALNGKACRQSIVRRPTAPAACEAPRRPSPAQLPALHHRQSVVKPSHLYSLRSRGANASTMCQPALSMATGTCR